MLRHGRQDLLHQPRLALGIGLPVVARHHLLHVHPDEADDDALGGALVALPCSSTVNPLHKLSSTLNRGGGQNGKSKETPIN